MFGLQKGPGQGGGFDLEQELKGKDGAQKKAALKKLAGERAEELKKALRQGSDKAEFDKAEILLHGYNALSQVLDKITVK